MTKIVCHISSAHPTEDVRIFHKECTSLAKEGYSVHLVVQSDRDYESNGVKIHALKFTENGRKFRMTTGVRLALAEALRVKANVYHLHDPELLRIASKLRKTGAHVIFDAHEDTVKQLLSKPYLNRITRIAASTIYGVLEAVYLRNVTGVIAATDAIKTKFLKLGLKAESVSNYPMLHEFSEPDENIVKEKNAVCYAGSISMIRGTKEIVTLARLLPEIHFHLAGPISDAQSQQLLDEANSFKNFSYHGLLTRKEVVNLYAKCQLGLLPFHKVPNHLESVPNKLYEYMAAQLPVVAMDIELWRTVLETNKAGTLVDYLDTEKCAKTIAQLLANPEKMTKMGGNGRNQVLTTYNWHSESEKLMKFYREITGE